MLLPFSFSDGEEVKGLPSSLASRQWCSQGRPRWSLLGPVFLSPTHAHTLLAASWSARTAFSAASCEGRPLGCPPDAGRNLPAETLLQPGSGIVQLKKRFPQSLVQTFHPADIPSGLPPLAKSHPPTGPWTPQLWSHLVPPTQRLCGKGHLPGQHSLGRSLSLIWQVHWILTVEIPV